MFYYRVFGMHVRSQMDFPELVESTADEWASVPSLQVEVEIGKAPDEIPEPKFVFDWIEADRTSALFKVAGRGKIYVSDGTRIRIEPKEPDKLIELRPYMITCGFATLAFHRGWIPLHAGAVRSPKGVILFCGPSGAGKSTTTTAVAKENGWQLLADDMIVLEPADRPLMHVGVKRIKLWEAAANALGVEVKGLAQDYFRPFKYHAEIEPFDSFSQSEVVAVVRLSWGDRTQYIPENQAFAFQELMNSVYPAYFGTIYLTPSVKIAALKRFFPVPFSGSLVRSRESLIGASLAEVAEIAKVLLAKI